MYRILISILVLAVSATSLRAFELPIDLENEIEPIEEYPIEIDALDEFIFSYYALLDNADYLGGFSFIKRDSNLIEYPQNLAPFLLKLMELRNGLREEVTIYQIGDSHIKPGYLSTTARSKLMEYFIIPSDSLSPTLSYQFKGINGASFNNLLPNFAIFSRCSELKPDLIIISLGTNDAQGRYDASRFRKELNAFMAKVEQYRGDALILFSLPADSHKQGGHNYDIAKVSDEIRAYAKNHGNSCWDLATVMGGRGSISKWRAENFASQDNVHFSPQGYMLQGYLFYDALMKAYIDYAERFE